MEKRVAVDEGAEAFIELLNANGVDCIFLNPGSDIFAVTEAIAKFQALGKRTPRVITSPHESVGMAAAHGYFMVSGKPQVVMVHVDVGTQQVGGALHNAQRGRIGVLFCAGRSPLSFEEDRRDGRKFYVHWDQDQLDQAGIARGYVKWHYELRTNENIHQVMQRAFQVAATEPCGPVYLTLPPELLLEKIDNVLVPDVARYAPPATPQADGALLSKTAELLIKAENPLIITGYLGRHPEAVAPLVKLAESLSIRVTTSQFRMNFPAQHPLWGGTNPNPYLKDADVVLIIDQDVPYIPTQARPRPGAKVIHIDIDPLKQSMPAWHFPVDVFIEADSRKALPALNEIIGLKVTAKRKAHLSARFQKLKSEHEAMKAQWHQAAVSQAGQKPITPQWLSRSIAEIINSDTIIVEEATTSSLAITPQIMPSEPGSLFKTGTSLGGGLGISLGVKLAAPDKTVLLLVGDGSFMYGCPTAALWAASTYNAPFLCIIFNNQRYNAIKGAVKRGYPESYSEKTGTWPGISLAPSPEYALVAQAANAYGQKVEDPAEVGPAVRTALEQVRSGRPAVLDVRIG